MDTSGNSSIEKGEVPERMQRVFDVVIRRLDRNEDGVLDRRELSQGGPPLAQIAGRYVQTTGVDTAAELRKLDQKLGAASRRFEAPLLRPEDLTNPQRARELFAQLDANSDDRLEQPEFPQQLRRVFQRLLRLADRDRDGRLSQREFLAAVEQMARRQSRRSAAATPVDTRNPAAAMPAESMPAADAMPAEPQ
jgi:Ca2+-binding EF-hand superfamily protein